MVDCLVKYGSVLGLLLSIFGAIIIAVVQSRLFKVVRAWLNSLDFTAHPGTPGVMLPGWDKDIGKAVRQNRWLSWLGWILIGVGVTLQICAALPSAFRGHCR
jgi:hypothetical protein